MKIKEVTSYLKHYVATIRVVTSSGTVTARTSVTADSQQQARAILIRLYGTENVFSVSAVMREVPELHQIRPQAAIPAQARHSKYPRAKRGSLQLSCVAETGGTKTRVLSPQELQVKALADKAEDYKQQEKALKARQEMAKAQQNLMKAQRKPNAS